MNSVLKRFLDEDATPHVSKLIIDWIDSHSTRPAEVLKRFEFNRFDVTLDFEHGDVLIEDVLTLEETGKIRFSLDEFCRYLAAGKLS